ncbi:MAG: MarR family transcriptional regulator [Oxalobacteraceae bacterium]|nr:MAG: MarR family transcriptional regulator [Oxalobacteraceae bacterium]
MLPDSGLVFLQLPLAVRRQAQPVRPAVARILALHQAGLLEIVDDGHDARAGNAHHLGQPGLRYAGIAADDDQRGKTLRRDAFDAERFSSLVIIGSNPGISQTRLAEVMGIARSGVVSIIDNFEQAGLVERQDSGDRRSYMLRLTPDGQRQLKKYKTAVREHDDRVAQQLSADERQQLRKLLGKLCIGPKA